MGGTFGWFQSGRAPNALITSSELMPPNPPMVRPEAPAQPSAPQAEPQVARAEPPGLQPAQQTVPVLVAEFKPAAVADAAATERLPAEPAVPAQPQEEPKPRPIATPVTVRLDIRPWGEVWVNGVARGISPPVKELRLIPGKYQVVLRNADLPYRGTLEIKAGKPAVISHVFE